jgi:hypothetical protein
MFRPVATTKPQPTNVVTLLHRCGSSPNIPKTTNTSRYSLGSGRCGIGLSFADEESAPLAVTRIVSTIVGVAIEEFIGG